MFDTNLAEIAQSVEHQFPKLKAAGSNPVFRSFLQPQPYFQMHFLSLFMEKV